MCSWCQLFSRELITRSSAGFIANFRQGFRGFLDVNKYLVSDFRVDSHNCVEFVAIVDQNIYGKVPYVQEVLSIFIK